MKKILVVLLLTAANVVQAQTPTFFTAIQQQLGLRLEAARGNVQALVIDRAEEPGAN